MISIRLALIGCGGAAAGMHNALSVANQGPVNLYAMADLHEEKLSRSYKALKKEFDDQVDVSADRKLLGFDAYRRRSTCSGPASRDVHHAGLHPPVHVEYAVQKGINVFMEKPFRPTPAGCTGCSAPPKRRRRRA